MKILRVFPRRTTATPDDDLAIVGRGPDMIDELQQPDEIHISVAFTWDLPLAEKLVKAWSVMGVPVRIGGPATGERGGEFVPGRYLKLGYVITSRGCPNHCWFCKVWQRDGITRELPITEGYNLLDDNILACSDNHIKAVFAMLRETALREHERVLLTGGLEARRLLPWHVQELTTLRPKSMFFAYDEPRDLEPLLEAGKMLTDAGFTRSTCRCYVLCGFYDDTPAKAIKRFIATWDAGFLPMMMLYRDFSHADHRERDWKKLQHTWCRPASVRTEIKRILK